MTSRVILFGATGYTGHLTAEALARRGTSNTVLAGRSGERLQSLAAALEADYGWTCEIAEADVTNPSSVADLIESPDDVLISTVGPFTRFGKPAIEAATSGGAIYLDSTGEPPFIRRVFDRYGPRAHRTGASLLTAFGYDYVPGNLAGALALAAAGRRHPGRSGRRRVLRPHRHRDPADAQRRHDREFAGSAHRTGLRLAARCPGHGATGSVGADLRPRRPRTRRAERRRNRALHAPAPGSGTRRCAGVPGLGGQPDPPGLNHGSGHRTADPAAGPSRAGEVGGARVAPGSSGGPTADDRAHAATLACAEAYAHGELLARVTVTGPSPYDLTAELLAWAAESARDGGLGVGKQRRTGALGPADGFGLDAFIAGRAEVGLAPTQ